MPTVTKPEGAKKWVIYWYDETGRRRKKTGTTDKGVTERIARELENQVALRRAGLVDPKAEAYREHEFRPLAAHLADFRRSLDAKGGTKRHPAVTESRALRVLELARVKRIGELTLSRVVEAMGRLRELDDAAAETINHHVRAIKGFSRWLWRDGRTRDHILAHLATSRSDGDQRRVRRAITAAEAARVVRAAMDGRPFLTMSGPDRAWAYELAMATGFRARELATLTPERFDLAGTPPTARVRGGYTKNKREAVQPLPPGLAGRLAGWLADKPAGVPVFDLPKRTADMLKVDLAAAGIPYQTDEGCADFHSLRAVYISNLIASGASVKSVQKLARHSTPSLTIGIYAKARPEDLANAVAALPDLDPHANRGAESGSESTDCGSLPKGENSPLPGRGG